MANGAGAAGGQNVIDVVIRGVDQMSPAMQTAEKGVRKFEGTTRALEQGSVKTTQSLKNWQQAMTPMSVAMTQVTGVTGGFSTALNNLLRFGLNPIVLGVTTAIVVINKWLSASSEAKKATEELTKAITEQANKVRDLNLDYRVLIGTVTELDAQVQKVRLAQAGQREEIEAQIKKLEQRLRIERELQATLGGFAGGHRGEIERLEQELATRRQILRALDDQLKLVEKTGRAAQARDFKSIMEKQTEEAEMALNEQIFKHQEALDAMRKADFDTMLKAAELQKQQVEEAEMALNQQEEDYREFNDKILRLIADRDEEIAKQAEETAEEMAKSFTDRFLAIMEGEKPDVLGFFRNLGKTIVSELLQEALKAQLIGPLRQSLAAGQAIPATATGFLGFGDVFKSIGKLFFGQTLPGQFRQVPGAANQPVPAILHGGEVVGRPEMGGITVNIMGDITPRQPNMRPQDVILVVADDMERGGKTARASINLQKRR